MILGLNGSQLSGLLFFIAEIAYLLEDASRDDLSVRALGLGKYYDSPDYLRIGEGMLKARRESLLGSEGREMLDAAAVRIRRRLASATVLARFNCVGEDSLKELAFIDSTGVTIMDIAGAGWLCVADVARPELDIHLLELARRSLSGFVLEFEGVGGGRGLAWDGMGVCASREPAGAWERRECNSDEVQVELERFLVEHP